MRLSPEECAAMIKTAGGLQKFAKLLDPKRTWNSNTVYWWKFRGISPDVQLDYYEHLQTLRAKLLK